LVEGWYEKRMAVWFLLERIIGFFLGWRRGGFVWPVELRRGGYADVLEEGGEKVGSGLTDDKCRGVGLVS